MLQVGILEWGWSKICLEIDCSRSSKFEYQD